MPFSDSLMFHKQIRANDGGYILIGHYKTIRSNGSGIIIRVNENGSLRWAKMITSNPFSGNVAFESIEESNNGNIHIIARYNNGVFDGKPPFHLLVLSSNGIVINQKRFGFVNSPMLNNKFVRTSMILKYGMDSLLYIMSGQVNAFTENQVFLISADNSGFIGSSTIINIKPSGGWDAPIFRNGLIKEKQLILYGSSGFIGQCVNGSSNGVAFFKMMVDINYGHVFFNKAYCAPANSTLQTIYQTPRDFFSTEAYDNTFLLSNGNVVMTKAYNGIDSSSSGITNRLFSISTFDSGFNYLNSVYAVTGNIMRNNTIQEIIIDSEGKRQFSFYDFLTRKINYVLADSSNTILLQKKIQLPSSKQYTDYTRINVADDKHLINLTFLSYDNNATHIDKYQILNSDTSELCFGLDTAFLRFVPAQTYPINWQSVFTSETGLLIEQPTNFFTVDYPLQKTVVCNIINKCDSIKLQMPDSVCTTELPVIITAYKNPLCSGKINFIFDTSQVKSYHQLNDTTIQLLFDRNWSGKIFAQPASCNKLADSAKLVVLEPGRNIDLGKDTVLCKGYVYKLNANRTGYKTYRWQDGSTESSYMVSSPGQYYVTVADYCGNTYSDTILIKPVSMALNAGSDRTICKYETATLRVAGGFLNYNWWPAYALSNDNSPVVVASPETSTTYFIRAEKFAGCFAYDTITVNVANCVQNIFFPSAFTPNNDGINDVFRPVSTAPLEAYELAIYNRWGQVVFTTGNIFTGWDAKFKSADLPTGSYVWVCRYKFRGQTSVQKKGNVALIR